MKYFLNKRTNKNLVKSINTHNETNKSHNTCDLFFSVIECQILQTENNDVNRITNR